MIKPNNRRAAALLMVLGALTLTAAASVGLARLASQARLMRQTIDRRGSADDLLHAARAPIGHWLEHEAGLVVLPAEAPMPQVVVLRDRWASGDEMHELRITAYDQRGMIPWRSLRPGSPLRLGLPAEVLAVMDRHATPMGGADRSLCLDEIQLEAGDPINVHPKESEGLAVGGFIATHPGPRSGGAAEQGVIINVNTAPLTVIETAMRLEGRDAVEAIVHARSQTPPRPASVPTSPPPAGAASASSHARFVGESDCWAFRIDCRVGPLKRSWWAVHQRVSGSNRWECVHRHAIIR